MLLFVLNSCDKIEIQDEPVIAPTIELKNVKIVDGNLSNKRVMSTDISAIKEITVNLNGEEMTGRFAFLNSTANMQRVVLLGKEGETLSYIDITNDNGVYYAKYYNHSGKLYLETNLENEVINIVGAYELNDSYRLNGSEVKGTNDYVDRFDDCVDSFVYTVSNDSGWAAVMTVGAMCCAPEILAGLAIGCGIKAI